LAIGADGRRAISGDTEGRLVYWDLIRGKDLGDLEGHKAWINAVVFAANDRLGISASKDQSLRVWDLKLKRAVASFITDDSVECCAAAGDGKRIAVGDADGGVHFLILEGWQDD
jgi:WD40 repeat protein